MRRVAAPVCAADAVNVMLIGEFTDLKRAIGKDEMEEVPTVNVFAELLVQEDMRLSEGCMRSWEAAFRKPVGLGDCQRIEIRWNPYTVEKGGRGWCVLLSIPFPDFKNCRSCFHGAGDVFGYRGPCGHGYTTRGDSILALVVDHGVSARFHGWGGKRPAGGRIGPVLGVVVVPDPRILVDRDSNLHVKQTVYIYIYILYSRSDALTSEQPI